ncbi:MAG: hypothetical protein ACT4OT_02335 [Acidobacteriota bacterium]
MASKSLKLLVLLPLFLVLFITERTGSSPQPALPNPVLYLVSAEPHQAGGKQFTRYKYDVFNKNLYPADFFAASPSLPPCGTNTKAARTWVDFYDQSGKRLNGFCALTKPADLNGIWFAIEEGTIPPSWAYIELTDRQTNTKYKSNLAETTE